MTNLDSVLKSRDITLLTKVCIVNAIFPVVRYRSESWTIKDAEQWRIDAFKLWPWRRLESPLECKEIKSVNPKGNQPWIFIGRTDAEAKAPILWPPDVKTWLIGKDPDAGKNWKQKEKGVVEDEMVRYQTVSDEIHPPVSCWVQCCCILWENKLCEFKIIWIFERLYIMHDV